MTTTSPVTLPESETTAAVAAETYVSSKRWSPTRPRARVIACSEGRLQESLDDFLQNHLCITYYDRLYAPGGPGALASSGYDLLRSDQFRRECLFLLTAHAVEEVVLIFHGGVIGEGPADATCADYRRKLPGRSPSEIAEQQQRDTADLLRPLFGAHPHLTVHIYRAEVDGNTEVRFVNLAAG